MQDRKRNFRNIVRRGKSKAEFMLQCQMSMGVTTLQL
ncbi:hypothetical protein ACFO5X_10695 [Seohaeicola nanhaiensis]|uniref:Uncharacterized protein n=1 Tax=Seohaeicola nanhaiensis TaxID=1387282 RepID=A0ABV9KGH4_9RHOB